MSLVINMKEHIEIEYKVLIKKHFKHCLIIILITMSISKQTIILHIRS